jgi:hypothetical protein
LTGIATSSYGNSNVTALLSNLGSNAISTTGNITVDYIVGDGSLLTGIVAPVTSVNSDTGAVIVEQLYDTRTSLYVVPSAIVHNPTAVGYFQSGYVGDGWTSTGFSLTGMTVTNFSSVPDFSNNSWSVSFGLEFRQAFFDAYVPGYTPDSLRMAQVLLSGPGQNGNYYIGKPNVATWTNIGTTSEGVSNEGPLPAIPTYTFNPAPGEIVAKTSVVFQTGANEIVSAIVLSPANWPTYLYLKIWVSD